MLGGLTFYLIPKRVGILRICFLFGPLVGDLRLGHAARIIQDQTRRSSFPGVNPAACMAAHGWHIIAPAKTRIPAHARQVEASRLSLWPSTVCTKLRPVCECRSSGLCGFTACNGKQQSCTGVMVSSTRPPMILMIALSSELESAAAACSGNAAAHPRRSSRSDAQ